MIAAAVALCSLALSGSVEADARVGVPSEGPAGVVRNDNTLTLKADATPAEGVRVRLELDVVYIGVPAATAYEDLSNRSAVDPFRIESDAAYVALDFGDHVFVRVGRQILPWGSAPLVAIANPMNALDLEDPFAFGEPIAHEMLWAQVRAGPIRLSGAVAPVFTPALLPPLPVADLVALYAPNTFAAERYELEIRTHVPTSVPWALRAEGTVASIDWALTHYAGRDDLPALRRVDVTELSAEVVRGSAVLNYPAVRVSAAELTTVLRGFTVWLEAAYVLPRPMDLTVTTPVGSFSSPQFRDPYVQLVAGTDYQIGNFLVGAQFVRGFIDEFGSDRVGNHAFAWVEGRLARDQLGVTLVTGVSEDGSSVVSPEIRWLPKNSLELALGGYATIGPRKSKFASALAGPDVLRARVKVWW